MTQPFLKVYKKNPPQNSQNEEVPNVNLANEYSIKDLMQINKQDLKNMMFEIISDEDDPSKKFVQIKI